MQPVPQLRDFRIVTTAERPARLTESVLERRAKRVVCRRNPRAVWSWASWENAFPLISDSFYHSSSV